MCLFPIALAAVALLALALAGTSMGVVSAVPPPAAPAPAAPSFATPPSPADCLQWCTSSSSSPFPSPPWGCLSYCASPGCYASSGFSSVEPGEVDAKKMRLYEKCRKDEERDAAAARAKEARDKRRHANT